MAAAETRIDGAVSSPVLCEGGNFLPGSEEFKRTDGGNNGVRQQGGSDYEERREDEPGAKREDDCRGRKIEDANEESRGGKPESLQVEWRRKGPDNEGEQRQASPPGKSEDGRWKDPDVQRCRGISGDER